MKKFKYLTLNIFFITETFWNKCLYTGVKSKKNEKWMLFLVQHASNKLAAYIRQDYLISTFMIGWDLVPFRVNSIPLPEYAPTTEEVQGKPCWFCLKGRVGGGGGGG